MRMQGTEAERLTAAAEAVITANGGGTDHLGTGVGREVRAQLEAAYLLLNRVRKTLGEMRADEELQARGHRTAGEISALQAAFDVAFGIPDDESGDPRQ